MTWRYVDACCAGFTMLCLLRTLRPGQVMFENGFDWASGGGSALSGAGWWHHFSFKIKKE